jgi:peptidoglycan/xylan/chitin deacetylase (PgdA/CDA1 family)
VKPRPYGPFPYAPIHRRRKLEWPGGARVALWVNPNIEFFALDDVMPGNVNERVSRDHARVPNVRNWSLRDYGNRIGVWRLMDVLARHGVRATAALNSEVCRHHPEIVAEAVQLGWELMGHGQTHALRINEMEPAREREAIFDALATIEAACGTRPTGWLGPGLAETWNTLEILHEAGVRYVCDWVNDDQPYPMEVGDPPMVVLPYSLQTNDVPAYFDLKASVPEFERTLKEQFDVLYREGEASGRVMAIAVHPFVTGQPHRIGALDRALEYICAHDGVWRATGREIVEHYRQFAVKDHIGHGRELQPGPGC